MKTLLRNLMITVFSLIWLTSCFLEAPKEKQEELVSSENYEKALDSLIGVGSIKPTDIKVGDHDLRIETINISNSLIREIFRRELKVTSVECYPALQDELGQPILDENGNTQCPPNPQQRQITYEVRIIERDSDGQAKEITTTRKTILAVNSDGYYEFFDDGNDKTIHSWDYIISLRGFCQGFSTDRYNVRITCSNMSVTAESWGHSGVPTTPVRVLGVTRQVHIYDYQTGESQSSKLRHTIRVAPGVQEISKVVSYCSEGMQQLENQIYYLVRCNNLESL